MGILSTGLSSKRRVLLSRQHTEVTKTDLEAKLANFTRLIEKQNGDHTFIETDNDRFLYQPIDEFYVFVMTTLDSNVVEDLTVVKDLAEIVQTVVQPRISEKNIVENLTDLIFYMDELISDGIREDLTLDQIKTYIEMQSHEEKVHKLIQDSKEKEERERRREIAAKLEKRQQLDHVFGSYSNNIVTVAQTPQISMPTTPVEMQLTRPTITSMSSYSINKMRQSNLASKAMAPPSGFKTVDAEAPAVVQVLETCNGNIHLDGDIDVLNVQGEIIMTVFEPSATLAAIEITSNPKAKMRFHPNIDKKLAASCRLQVQDVSNAFKIASGISLAKWRYKDQQESQLPLGVTCWPNASGSSTSVTVEIQNTSEKDVTDIHFQVLHSRYDSITVEYSDVGKVEHEADSLVWVLEKLEPEECAKFEFTTTSDIQQLLPFMLYAQILDSITNIQVTRCFDKDSGQDIDHVVKSKSVFSITIGE